MKRYLAPIIVILVLVSGVLAGCSGVPPSEPTSTETRATEEAPTPNLRSHIYTNGRIEVRGSGEPIELINNPDATNPTFAELVAFLERDRTDEYSYIFGPPKVAYICSDFAQDVHNNAEAAGIRAAWVGIDIEGEAEGHALNAFQTTDRGLVYIDCTGKGLWDESPDRSNRDRRARVEIGKPYAVADIDKAKTFFKFLISEPMDADRQYILGQRLFTPLVTDEQILRELESLGWIRIPLNAPERYQKANEMWAWSQTHHIEELGLKWMQEWIREHEVELYGRDFEPEWSTAGTGHAYAAGKNYVSHILWYVGVDCVDISWFQPVEKLIDVDGIPIVWKIRWEMPNYWKGDKYWYKPFDNGVVKDIHIHW